jgi:hypothetical protein
MPNFFTFIGPSWPIGNGSVMGPLEAVGDYVIQALTKFQNEFVKSFEVDQQVTDEFNEHVQTYMQKTVWTDDCRSWYKNNDTGRVNAIWPGSSLHYIEAIQDPRWEDFHWKYQKVCETPLPPFSAFDRCANLEQRNRWHFLGNGHSKTQVEGGDKSPYLNIDNIDKDWLDHADGAKKAIDAPAAPSAVPAVPAG